MVFMDFFKLISLGISIIGIAIIIWGALLIAFGFLCSQYTFLKNRKEQIDNRLRDKLGFYILLGLEFMIAGDIINTVLHPTQDALIILGSIVAIRTVISFFLNRELNVH